MEVLLNYFFPITTIDPTPAASTEFLKQVCVVVKPITPGVGVNVVTLCTSMAAVAALTDNDESQQLFDAGKTRVYILPVDELDLTAPIATWGNKFHTILISSDFEAADIIPTQASGIATITSYANLLTTTPDTIEVAGQLFTAQAGAATPGAATFRAATSNDATAQSLADQINSHPVVKTKVIATVVGAAVTIKSIQPGYDGNDYTLVYDDNGAEVGAVISAVTDGKLQGGDGLTVGNFKGVVGVSSDDDDFLEDQAVIPNRAPFHTLPANGAKNMFFAFGKLLSNNLDWKNQQYITVPFADDVDEPGELDNYFDLRINFALTDDRYGNRLGFFVAGGKAIVAPYIKANLELDLQSKGLSYVSANQPGYTITEASLLEDELQKVVDLYIERKWLTGGTAIVKLEQDNFVASSYFTIPTPKAMWRVLGTITQTN